MAIVLPIQGLRFTSEAEWDYSKIITPPYDVITAKRQEELYNKSPYNVIRLEYPRSLPDDNHQQNKYTRAAAVFNEWIEKGILTREKKPAIYLYEQHFSYNEKKYIRKSFFCGVGLSPFEEGIIIPHEETMHKPKEDRLELLRHCRTSFSPIFGLYMDRDKFVDNYADQLKSNQDPAVDFIDDDGQRHVVWAVTDVLFINAVTKFFKEKKIYIADGHHRYETALEYYRENQEKDSNPEKFNHTLMALVNIYDKGLLAFPTHRLLTTVNIKSEELLQSLSQYFFVKEFPEPPDRQKLLSLLDKSLTGADKRELKLGLYTSERKIFILTIKKYLQDDKKIFPWLDTFILQELVFKNIVNLENKSQLEYLRDEWEAKLRVDKGEASFAFFVNKPTIETIISLARQGIKMPQKSTYFFPKLVTGLVMLQLGTV